jgi:hypothetical protein
MTSPLYQVGDKHGNTALDPQLTFDIDCKFNKDAPNVVHMTVKPQEIIDEEDAKAAKAPYSREREANERSPGCRCIIQ